MQPKLFENHIWFSLQVYLLILSLAFLTGLEPVLHNHDLDETHQDCASCTWSGSNSAEPVSSFEKYPHLHSQNILVVQTQSIFTLLKLSNTSRAPPFFLLTNISKISF